MKLKIKIKLNNDAGLEYGTVGNALRDLAERLDSIILDEDSDGLIKDYNRNNIGTWEITV